MDEQNKPRQRKAVYGPILKRAGLVGLIAPIALVREHFKDQGITKFHQRLESSLQSLWQLSIQISVWTVSTAKAQAGKKGW